MIYNLIKPKGYNPPENAAMLYNQWLHKGYLWGWYSYETHVKYLIDPLKYDFGIRFIRDEEGDIGISFFNILILIKYKFGIIVEWFKIYSNAYKYQGFENNNKNNVKDISNG